MGIDYAANGFARGALLVETNPALTRQPKMPDLFERQCLCMAHARYFAHGAAAITAAKRHREATSAIEKAAVLYGH